MEKKTSCDYGPNARTLKNIRTKKTEYSSEVMKLLVDKKIDSSQIISIFENGTVIFSESDTKPDSCKIYVIEDHSNKEYIKIRVKNCENTVTVMEALLEKKRIPY